MERSSTGNRDDFWRLQVTLNELSTTQSQHTDRIMRLEKRLDDGIRPKNVWAPASPFPSVLGGSHHGKSSSHLLLLRSDQDLESSLNPAAEAFRNFDTDAGITALSLDNAEDQRRAAASRANSVRFDESANNHYGSSRQSIDLPTRTGSGLGSHPLSERSLSHRSDGRSSNAGFGRTNSFGLESSRLLGSIHNSPKVSINPPPGFFVLGPCPSIIRCWLTETFSNDSLLYAALCTGASSSSIGRPLLEELGLADQIADEGGFSKIKLPVYLTEARIQQTPRSGSPAPAPQVPTLFVKFVVVEDAIEDKSIQVMIGSDVLRAHNGDILFSQDKLNILDDERNQLTVPLVRPENEASYKNLTTGSRRHAASTMTVRPSSYDQSRAGIIGQPSKPESDQSPASPMSQFPPYVPPTAGHELSKDDEPEPTPRTNGEIPPTDSKSATGSEKSTSTPTSKSNSGVWGSSWRASATTTASDAKSSSNSYSRPAPSRTMKVLRPNKSSTNISRTVSASNPFMSAPEPTRTEEPERKTSVSDAKSQNSAPTRTNPVGTGSAFGWLNSGGSRKTTANGT